MRVVYFGTYSMGEGYPRNRVLIEGLRRAGVEVEEVHEGFWEDAAHKIAGATGGAARLRLAMRYSGAWLRLAARYLRVREHDAVVVGYTGQIDLFAAKALAALSGRPVVLDAFLSLYDTIVRDRGLVRDGGPFARLLDWIDTASCRLADLVLTDTDGHRRYFSRRTRLPESHFARLFVGEDDVTFPPLPLPERAPGEPIRVLWFGTWVPLQGVETVLDAAERLEGEGVVVRMVGRGQLLSELGPRAEAIPTVELVGEWLDYGRLLEEIRGADACLGVFGTTEKADRVIPCKVFDSLATARPVITADTSGARELLRDGESALLVAPGDADALAGAIRRLAKDAGLRRRLAEGGHRCFVERASPDALGRRFRALLAGIVRRER